MELLKVAVQLSSKMKVKLVGTSLGVPDYAIEAALGSNAKFEDAAHDVLTKWRDGVGDPVEARRQLIRALRDSGLDTVVTSALQ